MNIRGRLIVFLLLLIIFTGGAATIGAAFLTLKQTVRQNHDRLVAASQSFTEKLIVSLATIKRNLDNFIDQPSAPTKVVATISFFKDPEKNLQLGADYLIDDLYSLGRFSDVDSLAFYIPLKQGDPYQWIFTYDSDKDEVIGFGDDQKVSLFTSNNWGTYDQTKTTRPGLFPSTYKTGPKYSLETRSNGITAVLIREAFTNKSFLYEYKPGDQLGYFMMRKLFDPWKNLDQQMGVNFAIYDINGKLQGSQIPMKNLDVSILQNGQIMTELLDQDGNTYNSFIIPINFNGDFVCFLSTNIPQSVTSGKIRETVIALVTITLLILVTMVIVSWAAVTHFTNPILRMTTIATAIAEGNLELKIETDRKDELGTLARAFARMRDAIKNKIVELRSEITERNQAEQNVRKLNEELELKVRQMELQQIQLNKALEALEANNKLKDEFLANTSHELRTPLNGIIGLAESLIDGITGKLSDKTRANLAMIVSSGKRLATLVNDILDFSKLRHSKIELQLKPVGLHEIVDIVFTLSQPLIHNKPVQLVNAIPSDLPPAQADENRLQQIFHNLVGNAIKFTPKGSIEISGQVVNSHLEIVISDTGIGIPEDKLDRVFESFEQAEGSTAREYGGTGIGLTITKQLIQLHNGDIWITSTVGQGSQFFFTLPISEESANPLVDTLESPTIFYSEEEVETLMTTISNEVQESTDNQFTILIVDDEPVNLQVINNYLLLQNYHVVQATSGIETLTLIMEEGFKPDAILLDVMMPKITGYEVTRKIRDKWQADELPILFLTAKNQVTELVTGLESGANDYLTKPISKHELLARLKMHLRLRILQTEAVRLAAVEAVNQMIMESLRYAKSIQSSLLPNLEQVTTYLPNSFFLWKPRDIVGGDIFYIDRFDDSFIVAVMDCTGHGIPGAFMTMIALTHLRQIIKDEGYREPSEILTRLNSVVKKSLQQDTEYATSDDGLDIALCWVKPLERALLFAGARLPLYYIQQDAVQIIKGDKQSLGYKKSDLNFTFTTHTIKIEPDRYFYLSTDGFIEQIGGTKGFPFGNRRFKDLLLEHCHYPFNEQGDKLFEAFNDYKNDYDRLDDVTVLGFKV